jgi:GTP-binding protein YchF
VKLGIVGLPNVGKTTLFNALTHANAAATAYAYTSAESNLGVVAVPDERLDRLHAALETQKKVNATIDIVDIAGLAEGASRGEGLGNRFLADIRGVEAVAHVVRVFSNPDVVHVRATVDPAADVDLVEMELVLSDLELVERRVEKTRKAARSGDKGAQHELAVLEELAAWLLEGRLARSFEREADDAGLFRELALVSDRPVLFVLNTDDDQSAEEALAAHAGFVEWARGRGDQVVAVAARLEAELADLEPEEAAEFRAALGGGEEGAVGDFLRAAYDVLGYISFFTGDFRSSESRAWQLPRGWTAKQAAGRIHSDIEHGFVRAQVVNIEDLIALRSFHAAREKALQRTEGKEYTVQDGDVINFMHTG